MRFRLVQRSSTVDDLEILLAAKCSSMTLVSGNIRHMGYSRRCLWAGCQMTVGLSTTTFWRFGWLYTSSETLEIRPAILHGNMLSLVGHAVTDCKTNDLE